MKAWLLPLLGILATAPAIKPASASAMLDCPMRDAPFSVKSPLIDILLSDAAKAVMGKHFPGAIAEIPPFLTGTKAPTFSSIITIEKIGPLVGVADAAGFSALDADLRLLKVTDADKVARCQRYDDERPIFNLPKAKLRVLIFEKVTGFYHTAALAAADAAFKAMAERNGWALVVTNKGGVMHPSILRQFDVVIWNNVSGDVLTLSQRKAFRDYIEGGGGFVGIHASAGDFDYFWDWYPNALIGARFIGHPSNPQFQNARIRFEKNPGGIGEGIEPAWTMKDEWYSFANSARVTGSQIVATLDESSYVPGSTRLGGPPLAMGADHPIAWTRKVGRGRSFYSAIGHLPESYADVRYVGMLEQAVLWAGKGSKKNQDRSAK